MGGGGGGGGGGGLGRGRGAFLEKGTPSPPQTPPYPLQRLLTLSNPCFQPSPEMGKLFLKWIQNIQDIRRTPVEPSDEPGWNGHGLKTAGPDALKNPARNTCSLRQTQERVPKIP